MARRRLEVQLGADVRRFQSGMSRANRTVQNFQSKLKRAGKVGAAALAAIGAASVKMASDFDREMTKVETLVGLSRNRVQGLRDDVLQMARDTGQAPKALAQGFFRLTSGGIRGADAMQQLRSAAEAAAVGMGNLANLTRTATTAANAFPGSSFTDVLNTMVVTVREGQIRVQRFQRALSQVQSPAAELGISFKELSAFLAAASRVMGGTQKAARGLRAFLARLQDPTTEMQEAWDRAGLSLEEFRQQLEGGQMGAAFTDLKRRAEASNVSIANLVGSTRAWAAITAVAGNNLSTFQTILGRMGDTAGAVDEAFERTGETTALTFSKMIASIKAAAVQLGEQLAPAAEDIAEAFETVVTLVGEAAAAFGRLPGPVQDLALALGMIATVATPVVIALNQLVGLLTALQAATGAATMIGGLTTALSGMATVLTGMVPALLTGGAVYAGFKALQSVLRDVGEEAGTVKASMDEMKDSVSELSEDALKRWHRQTHNAWFQAKQLRRQVDNMIGRFGASKVITEEMAKKLGDASLAGRTLSEVQTALFNRVQQLNTLLEHQTDRLEDLRGAGEGAAEGTEAAARAMADAARGRAADVVMPLRVRTLAEGGPGRRVSVPAPSLSFAGKGPDEVQALQRRVESLRSSLQTEAERIRSSMATIDEALRTGIITPETASKLRGRLRERLSEVTDEMSRFEKTVRQGARRVGETLIEGIILGADNMTQVLKRFLARLASTAIIGQLSGFLGIASPSRLTAQMGADLARGLVVGMQSMEGRLAAASRRVAASSVPSPPPAMIRSPTPTAAGAGAGQGEITVRFDPDSVPNPPTPEDPAVRAEREYWQRLLRRGVEVAVDQGFDPRGQFSPSRR